MRFPILLLVTLAACSSPRPLDERAPPVAVERFALPGGFDAQGHRGARGLLPENTVAGMLRALDSGMTTLELDLSVTADGVVVLSHEPWMSADICSHPDGSPVAAGEAESLLIYRMTLAQAQAFDCGSRGNARFPEQNSMPAHKPALSDVIAAADAHARQTGRPLPFYNVETKSRPTWDGERHPAPDAFAALVIATADRAGALERTTIQSFDVRTLRSARRLDPRVPLALLVDDGAPYETPQQGADVLGFSPDVWSPYHQFVTPARVREAHAMGMRVVPWTVNDAAQMADLIAMGVDGLITDYPNRLRTVLDTAGSATQR